MKGGRGRKEGRKEGRKRKEGEKGGRKEMKRQEIRHPISYVLISRYTSIQGPILMNALLLCEKCGSRGFSMFDLSTCVRMGSLSIIN